MDAAVWDRFTGEARASTGSVTLARSLSWMERAMPTRRREPKRRLFSAALPLAVPHASRPAASWRPERSRFAPRSSAMNGSGRFVLAQAQAPAPRSREQIADQARRKIAGFFKVPLAKVTDQAVVDDIEGWDSTTHVGLILELEDDFGIEFDVERVSAFENVGELIDECVQMIQRR